MKTNERKYAFIVVGFLSLVTLSILAIFMKTDTHMLLLSLVLLILSFEVVQLIRIFKMGMVYKKWINHEISYSIFIFALFLSVPNLLRFSFFLGTLKYFAIFSLICITIFLFGLMAMNMIYRNSFYNSNPKSFSEVKDILDEKNIEYNIKESFNRFGFFNKKKSKEIQLPKYGCEIFKTKEDIIIKPKDRKKMKNVYSIIDILEQ